MSNNKVENIKAKNHEFNSQEEMIEVATSNLGRVRDLISEAVLLIQDSEKFVDCFDSWKMAKEFEMPFKLRFWDQINRRMLYPNIVSFLWCKFAHVFYKHKGEVFQHIINLDNLDISKFTGFYDRNGKEIWEGDVVDSSLNRGNNVVKYGSFLAGIEKCHCPCKVEHPVLVNGWYIEAKNKTFSLVESTKEFTEVIGNVFENSELVGDGNEV